MTFGLKSQNKVQKTKSDCYFWPNKTKLGQNNIILYV